MLSDLTFTGRDAPFVNNYGVWEDEFKELGLRDTLEYIWPDALCYFGEDKQVGSSSYIRISDYLPMLVLNHNSADTPKCM